MRNRMEQEGKRRSERYNDRIKASSSEQIDQSSSISRGNDCIRDIFDSDHVSDKQTKESFEEGNENLYENLVVESQGSAVSQLSDSEGQINTSQSPDNSDNISEAMQDVTFNDSMSRHDTTYHNAYKAINDMISGHDHSKLFSILRILQDSHDMNEQAKALQELSNILVLSSEDILSGYSLPDPFIKAIARLMRQDNVNPEVILLACRCLTAFLEALPTCAFSVVNHGLVESLCQKLLDVEFIDLAEQALAALEKISVEYPATVTLAGGLNATLAYVEFLSAPVQRLALTIAANCSADIPERLLESAAEALVRLENFIKGYDQRVIQQSCLAICRLVNNLSKRPDLLEKSLRDDLLLLLLEFLNPSQSKLIGYEVQANLLKSIGIAAKASPLISLKLLEMNIANYIALILTGAIYDQSVIESSYIVQNLFLRSMDQKNDTINIIINILPQSNFVVEFSKDFEVPTADNKTRLKLFESKNVKIRNLAETLTPILMQTYICSTSTKLKMRIVLALLKIITNISISDLEEILRNISMSAFLAIIFSQPSENLRSVLILLLIEYMQLMLPHVYVKILRREGIIAWIKNFILRSTEEINPEYKSKHKIFLSKVKNLLSKHRELEAQLPVDRIPHLNLLIAISRKLKQNKKKQKVAFESLARLFDNDEGITGYEVITSKLDEALLHAFNQGGDSTVKHFINAFLNLHTKNPSRSRSLSNFVSTMQSILNQLDKCLLFVTQNDDMDKQNTLGTLTRQIRIRLKNNQPNVPEIYKTFMVSVHVVASLKAIKNYIETKVNLLLKSGTSETSEDSKVSSVPKSFSQSGVSYAKAAAADLGSYEIVFELNGKKLDEDTTIFSVLSRSLSGNKIDWTFIPVLHYKFVPKSEEKEDKLNLEQAEQIEDTKGQWLSPKFENILLILRTLSTARENQSEVFDLPTINHLRSLLPLNEFINMRLTAKLHRQLGEPLVVASFCLPSWAQYLIVNFYFLFPFEIRLIFLQSTSFGYSRCIYQWFRGLQNMNTGRDDQISNLGRIQRQKIRISRSRILDSAIKVMELYGCSSPLLEIEYFEEVGSGLGPTLEFYSLVSKQLHNRSLNIWRESGKESADAIYVDSFKGFFPAPIDSNNISKYSNRLKIFHFLGQFVARSLLDSRIIDIHFNPLFFAAEIPLTINSLFQIDEPLARSLNILAKFLEKGCEENPNVRVDGVKVNDLELVFVLAGVPEIELIKNGSEVLVTTSNLQLYIAKTLDFTLGTGIRNQIEAFRKGLCSILPSGSLDYFTKEELVSLFGWNEEDWSVSTLNEAVRADHGYKSDNQMIKWFIEVLSEFSKDQRKKFLQFITGAPKLPIGGFRNLIPPLTVVKKSTDADKKADDFLPSVMTCVNYLKLPSYSSKKIMLEKLTYAMQEGKDSFHLS